MNAWGALPLGDGRTRFRIWAPDSPAVLLERDGAAPLPMQADAAGWHELTAAAEDGTRYRYRMADGLLVPDPASRLQDGDVHDASVIVDPARFRWRHDAWRGRPWHEAVIYELHVGCCGGFAGVMADLPRLAALGITAIELMPIAEFPGARNWGYDGVLPFAPDTAYGTPAELAALIDAAHGHGLMVLLDVVFNHLGPDGAYLHAYARRFFDEGVHTPWGAAIDFRQAPVRAFFEENALYWLRDFRFDGLRLDAVHAIAEPEWLDTLARRVRQELPDRHVHLVLENERNDSARLAPGLADAQWNDDGHNILHPLLTGERDAYYADFAEDGAAKLATVLQHGFLFQGQHSEHLGHARGTASSHLPPTAFVLFLQNHDQVGNRAFGERLNRLAHPQALAAATALLLLSPQIPLLFMGEEWGASAPFLFFTDHNAELAPLVRDGRRREFARFAAFDDAQQRERIPDPNAATTFTASFPDTSEAARPPHAAILALHRTLLRLRHQHVVAKLPGTNSLGASAIGDAAVLARWRLGDGSVLTLAVNLADRPVAIVAGGTLLFESLAGAAGAVAQGELPPRCTVAWLDPPHPVDLPDGPMPRNFG